MCKETPDIEKCQTSYFMNRFVSSGSLSLFLCLCLAICLFLFCFVGLFSKAVFDANFGLGMYHFDGSFHFWALLWGLVLRSFSTCSSLLSFSHFSLFLWLLYLLVAFFLFSLSLGRRRAPFPLLCATFSFFCLFFFCCCCCFVAGPSSTQLFAYWFCSHQFAELGSIHCLAFSARAYSLAFPCLAILFLAICRAVYIYI